VRSSSVPADVKKEVAATLRSPSSSSATATVTVGTTALPLRDSSSSTESASSSGDSEHSHTDNMDLIELGSSLSDISVPAELDDDDDDDDIDGGDGDGDAIDDDGIGNSLGDKEGKATALVPRDSGEVLQREKRGGNSTEDKFPVGSQQQQRVAGIGSPDDRSEESQESQDSQELQEGPKPEVIARHAASTSSPPSLQTQTQSRRQQRPAVNLGTGIIHRPFFFWVAAAAILLTCLFFCFQQQLGVAWGSSNAMGEEVSISNGGSVLFSLCCASALVVFFFFFFVRNRGRRMPFAQTEGKGAKSANKGKRRKMA
jgi:hypothetical protein